MEKLRPISTKILLFIKSLWLIGQKIAEQIVLPNRKRKGNILSSLLLLFISLTDLVTSFSWGISFNSLSRWKHYDRICFLVKKGTLIVCFLLFLLSSVEWSYPAANILNQKDTIAKAEKQPVRDSATRVVSYYSFAVTLSHDAYSPLAAFHTSYDSAPGYFTSPKIYLHCRNIRI